MSEYNRLTYKNERGEWCIDKTKDNAIVPCQDGDKRYYIGEPIDRLAELEDKIERWKLVEFEKSFKPKFSIYENVYIIDHVDENNFSLFQSERNEKTKAIVRKCFVTYIYQTCMYSYWFKVQPEDLPKELLDNADFHQEYWDRVLSEKELYKTREQAEARLKELRGYNI